MSNTKPIDFVVPWVDDKDPVWFKKKAEYTGAKAAPGNEDARYRDWDTLKYWFRGVEKFAPFVRYVYFITDDQKPEWLNVDHPKLKWVKHTDFIPQEYLPTFSANPIEWNLHRIDGLSDNFVYLNDDVFLIDKVAPEDFFVDDLPCDSLTMDPIIPKGFFPYLMFNNFQLINRHFSPVDSFKKHRKKWIKAQSLSGLLKNFWYGRKPFLYGICDYHIQNSYNKSTFDELWEKEYDVINNTCKNRSRSKDDVTIWSVRYFRLLNGQFHPKKPIGKSFSTNSLSYSDEAIKYIKNQKGKVICLNDSEDEVDFERHQQMVIEAFEKILPEKSSFEL